MATNDSTNCSGSPAKGKGIIAEFTSEYGEELGARELIRLMDRAARRWCWTVDAIMDDQRYGQGKTDPIPQWALQRLTEPQMQREGVEEFNSIVELLKTVVDVSDGEAPRTVYELVTARHGHRLEGQFVYLQHAKEAIESVRQEYPDAFIARINPRQPTLHFSDPALLDTLIGCIRLCGTTIVSDGEEAAHTVQDETGRTVTVQEHVLRAHEAFSRMSSEAQARLTPRPIH